MTTDIQQKATMIVATIKKVQPEVKLKSKIDDWINKFDNNWLGDENENRK